ncbi:hypothetical protein [Methyloglobulus sp.]|uniref:hypothetical protein n=1 Tax=Methyloglobulus sp. TaxID=2518622 RepID=UPI0032B830A7
MTTAARVDKLYSKLSPEELAGLAFEATVRGDKAEHDAILASVGKRTYVCLDQRFCGLLTAYCDLGMFYGVSYWKNRAHMAYAETLHEATGDDKSKALRDHLLDSAIAMDVALQAVCAKMNIDVLAVKTVALCVDEASFSESDKSELVKEYTDLFAGFIAWTKNAV